MSFIIRLQNLARSAKSSDIRGFFSSLSIPGGSVCIVGGDSGEAFIGFATDEDARQAMFRDGLVLCDNRVKLSLSSRKEMQDAMERAQQLIKKPAEVPQSNSWLSNIDQTPVDEPKTSQDNSWKEFLEQALQRIEKAKSFSSTDQGSIQALKPNDSKTGASMLGPPRNFNDTSNGFSQKRPNNFSSFQPPNKKPPFNNNYRQQNKPFQSFPPKFSPPNNQIKYDDPIQTVSNNDYEADLIQQQLAAVEQMNVPSIRQIYDPEQLFVEFSRLPPNLINLNAFVDFIAPIIPLEIRVATNNDIHMCTVVYCANSEDAFKLINRDGEAGIKVRWSGRQAFFSLPTSKPLSHLNPHVWDIPITDQFNKRPAEPFHPDLDLKRPKIVPRQESSWVAQAKDQLEHISFVLLSNVSYKASNWDISRYAEEIGVNLLKTTHVFSPDSERSDKWIVECKTLGDANRMIEKQSLLFGRLVRSEILSAEAAQDIYKNGYQSNWQPHKQQNPPKLINSDRRPLFPPPKSINGPIPSFNNQISPVQSSQGGGFFSGSAYGNIRSAKLPNPTEENDFKNQQDEFRRGNSRGKDFFGNMRGSSFRGGNKRGSFRGGRGFHSSEMMS